MCSILGVLHKFLHNENFRWLKLSFNSFFREIYSTHWKGRIRENDKETRWREGWKEEKAGKAWVLQWEGEGTSLIWFTSLMPSIVRGKPGGSWEPEISSGSPLWVPGTHVFLLPAASWYIHEIEWGRADLELRCSNMVYGWFRGLLKQPSPTYF